MIGEKGGKGEGGLRPAFFCIVVLNECEGPSQFLLYIVTPA